MVRGVRLGRLIECGGVVLISRALWKPAASIVASTFWHDPFDRIDLFIFQRESVGVDEGIVAMDWTPL